MKNLIKGKWKWGGLIIAMLLLVSVKAFADDINFRIEVPDGAIKNEAGATLISAPNVNPMVQIIQKGAVIETVNVVNGGFTYQKKISINPGDTFQLRATWNSSDGNISYYRKSSIYTWQPGNPPPPLYTWAGPSFGTYYIEEAPPTPTIGDIAISYTGELKPIATIPINVVTTHHEVSTRHIKIWEYPSGSVKVDINCGASYSTGAGVLQLNTIYSTEASATNAYGTSGISEPKGFEIKGPTTGAINNLTIKLEENGNVTLSWQPQDADAFSIYQSTDDGKTWTKIIDPVITGDETKTTTIADSPDKVYYQVKAEGGSFADEIVGKISFSLKKVADKTGLNSIALPFDTNGEAVILESKVIMNAQGIAESIGDNFESLGRWNETAQTSAGFTKTDEGFVGINFDVNKNAGYQVSVSEDTNWTIVGQLSGKI